MKRAKTIAKGIGKVTSALAGGVLMPILIWIALGVVIRQKLHERDARRETAPTISEVLAAAELSIHDDSKM